MSKNSTILRFDEVSFGYGYNKPILDDADFSIRQGSKITIMGQNGAGKSTIFGLINKEHKPDSGQISYTKGTSIAISRQVIPRDEIELTIKQFFEKCFDKKIYDIDPRIDKVLDVVHLTAPHDRIIKTFSGGQQARLLLASALIQNPDLLLLDEPTNNLDKAGIEHLTDFLKNYKKTCIVISHEEEFLNSFTDGVLYLDVFTHKVEQYVGNYFDVVQQIKSRIEKENRKNFQLEKQIQNNKDKANFFANKGGKMRLVAKKMRERVEEMEEEKVDTRREDKPIRPFIIPSQKNLSGVICSINSFNTIKDHVPIKHESNIVLKKNTHLLLKGPNGIGKSSLLESIASGNTPGVTIPEEIKIGYYRQDFTTLNFDDTVFESLMSVMEHKDEEIMRSIAAGFLITEDVIHTKIGSLSEGQKGLVSFIRLILQKPGLLILDEPTNHINFRHLPIIAEALNQYDGAMILVSHVPDFVKKIRIDDILDLESDKFL